ncbi:SIMPL domain-containing protein [Pseudomonas sp. N040]|uniref:SIMPL domain-containing protein n=1 Tax=Pseudomonas sp. N040 TaxID=2785325 RepID=UPI0018A257A2|nr:SIMPL domain-containing protein [Pseudomonas sp. N040]MBF7730282.1 SIMPL domain-containing protein [Pseudomonas sp. N040]MBW7013924.1 SIMPL domain-containing protein [Pseudomonas sp. N040]
MRNCTSAAACLAFASAVLLSLPAVADDLPYNQVALRAEVSRTVAHDDMQVILYSEAQDRDPEQLASLTSKTMNSALSKARAVKDVRVSLGSRHSYPLYDAKTQQLTGWRERAELRLESSNFAALAQLAAELVGELKMGGMSFSIAAGTRQATEDLLLKDAIQAFNARAALVSQALGGKSFRLVSLNLNSAGFQPPMPMRMSAMKGMAMADAAPPQEIEAGSSEVLVTADGVIEVLMP